MCKDSRVMASNGGSGKVGLCSQKVKRQKVPKRGPGVAELEKLLREQKHENGAIIRRNNNSSSSSIDQELSLVKFWPNSHHPLSNSSCRSLPFGPNQCFSGKSSGGLLLPSSSTNGSRINTKNMFPCPSRLEELGQCYPQGSRQCFVDIGSMEPSSSSVQASGGVRDSSRTSKYYCSNWVWPREDKMGEANIPFPFLKEIPPVPPFHHKIHAFSSLARGNQAKNFFNPEPAEIASRSSKAGCSPGPSFWNHYVGHGASDGKFVLLGSSGATHPWTTVPPRNDESKLNRLYFQDFMEEQQEQRRGRLNQARPFLGLLTMDHTGTAEKGCSMSNEKAEANSDGVDLDLRL